MTNPKTTPPLHGFSVATLLLLTAVVAIGAAAARTIFVASEQTIEEGGYWSSEVQEAGLRAVAGGMIGLLVGIGIGATRPRPVAGVVLGILVGGCVGAFAGGVLADSRNLPVAAIGSALLLLVGIVVRVLSPRPHEQ
jgi:hypothetical protein